VPEHALIEGYLAALRGRLPADTVDELADGLIETFDRQRSAGLDADAAARAAVAHFGDAERVLAAFARQAPGRHAARVLLAVGPLVGGCWAATLVIGDAARWPVPVAVRPVLAGVLIAAVVALLAAAVGVGGYRGTNRTAAAAGLCLICLDAAALSVVAVTAPPLVWPMALALPASAVRIAFTAGLIPRLVQA